MLGVFRKPQFVKTVLRNGVTAKFCTTVEEPPQRWEKSKSDLRLEKLKKKNNSNRFIFG